MFMKVILGICFIPIPIIMYFVLLNETKPKKNLILGVTLPKAARQDSSVTELCRKFKITMSLYLLVTMLLAIPGYFLKYSSSVFLYLTTWLLLSLFITAVPYALYNRRLKALKAQKSWYGEAAGLTLVDINIAVMPKRKLSVFWFIPPVLISIVPIVYTALSPKAADEFLTLILVYSLITATVILYWFLYRIIYRQKAETVDESSELAAALTQVRSYNWGKCWLLSAWLSGLFSIGFWLLRQSGIGVLIISLTYSVILTVIVLSAEFKTRKVQQKLTEDSGKAIYTDDDDKWILGIIYCNPLDSHSIVNRRVGIGATINIAKAPGIILIGICILSLLSMPLIGLIMMRDETTPVTLLAEDTQLAASHVSTTYIISYSDIESAGLIDTLPSGSRTNGTAMDNVLKGSFNLKGIGPCRLCLDPRCAPYIEIKAAGRIYILGSSDSCDTLDIYNTLINLAPALKSK
jgi:uncharacterized membrane protein